MIVLLNYLIHFFVFVFILNHICYNNHTVDTVCAATCVTPAPMLTLLCCIAIIEIISVFYFPFLIAEHSIAS